MQFSAFHKIRNCLYFSAHSILPAVVHLPTSLSSGQTVIEKCATGSRISVSSETETATERAGTAFYLQTSRNTVIPTDYNSESSDTSDLSEVR